MKLCFPSRSVCFISLFTHENKVCLVIQKHSLPKTTQYTFNLQKRSININVFVALSTCIEQQQSPSSPWEKKGDYACYVLKGWEYFELRLGKTTFLLPDVLLSSSSNNNYTCIYYEMDQDQVFSCNPKLLPMPGLLSGNQQWLKTCV